MQYYLTFYNVHIKIIQQLKKKYFSNILPNCFFFFYDGSWRSASERVGASRADHPPCHSPGRARRVPLLAISHRRNSALTHTQTSLVALCYCKAKAFAIIYTCCIFFVAARAAHRQIHTDTHTANNSHVLGSAPETRDVLNCHLCPLARARASRE